MTVAAVMFAHTGETCADRGCGDGFGYQDTDSVEERRRGCRHIADVLVSMIAEREAEHAAMVGRVGALADEWEDPEFIDADMTLGYAADRLRSALGTAEVGRPCL